MGKEFDVECWGLHSFMPEWFWSPPPSLHSVRTCCEIYIIQPKQWNSFCLLMAFEDVEKWTHLIRGWKFQTVHFFYWIWCQNYVPCFIHAIWISKLEWPNRMAPLWCVTNLQCPAGYQEDWNSLLGGHMSPKHKSKFKIVFSSVADTHCTMLLIYCYIRLALVNANPKKSPYSVTICHPSKKRIFTRQFFPLQGSWLCLRCETCSSYEKTSHPRSYYVGYYYASQVSRRLDPVFAAVAQNSITVTAKITKLHL